MSDTTANTPGACGYCGLHHGTRCPSVKAFEYHPDGTVKRVEFFAPNDSGPNLVLPGDPAAWSSWQARGFGPAIAQVDTGETYSYQKD